MVSVACRLRRETTGLDGRVHRLDKSQWPPGATFTTETPRTPRVSTLTSRDLLQRKIQSKPSEGKVRGRRPRGNRHALGVPTASRSCAHELGPCVRSVCELMGNSPEHRPAPRGGQNNGHPEPPVLPGSDGTSGSKLHRGKP